MKFLTAVAAICLSTVLVVPAFADSFVPSIEQKISPDVISIVLDENGQEGAIKINEITVESVSEMKGVLPKTMEKAYQLLAEKKSITKVIDGLNEYVSTQKNAPKVENLTVRELLLVTFFGKTAERVNHGKATLKIAFDLKLNPKRFVAVAIFDGETWSMIPAERVSINEDGNLILTLGHDGPIAIMTEKTK